MVLSWSLSATWRELIKCVKFSNLLPQKKVLVPYADVALLSMGFFFLAQAWGLASPLPLYRAVPAVPT